MFITANTSKTIADLSIVLKLTIYCKDKWDKTTVMQPKSKARDEAKPPRAGFERSAAVLPQGGGVGFDTAKVDTECSRPRPKPKVLRSDTEKTQIREDVRVEFTL